MPEREKGSATLDCPTCGRELAAETQPDGSLAASTCSKCHPKTEAAAEKAEQRMREQGTLIDGEGDTNG
jgi:DNA-directed RNA polymerase subunit M/transcription elongation factor TFIIS